MREQINDEILDAVHGGTVILSRDNNTIGFTTLGQNFELKNCTYYEAFGLVDTLYVNNKELSDLEFDKLVRKAFKQNGWI